MIRFIDKDSYLARRLQTKILGLLHFFSRRVYHHYYFSKCSDSKLKRFNKPSTKQKSREDEKGRKSTLLSTESKEILNLFCCWCSKKKVDANLVPAETHQTTKLTTKSSNHAKDLTAK